MCSLVLVASEPVCKTEKCDTDKDSNSDCWYCFKNNVTAVCVQTNGDNCGIACGNDDDCQPDTQVQFQITKCNLI